MENVIQIDHLYKSFGDVKAVNDLSFRVKKGEFFAFLGVNGAGKSTTISILCGSLRKDEGSVLVDGKDVSLQIEEILPEIGVVFQNSVLDGCLSVKDNLYTRAALYGITGKRAKEKIGELAELLDFKDLLGRQVGKLSGGQRRRIDVARALLNDPAILILDEPTTGLHFDDIRILMDVLQKLVDRGNTVLIIEHNLDVIKLADYIIDMGPEGGKRGGQVLSTGTPEAVAKSKKGFTPAFIKSVLESAAQGKE